jgi:anhydro-N-acetylmuramic acid kinase
MTGTSMDGIDISLVRTNGIELKRLNENYFYPYSNQTKDFLLKILKDDINSNLKRKTFLDEIITQEHYQALKNLDIIKKTDLIGFHGQTIHHDPDNQISVQLGNPKKLAKMLNKNVIFNFRYRDIKMGGQGAPLAPIYHKLIIEKLNLELPSCILNIGGVANLTYWDGDNLIGFDTGPGNALMDNYTKTISNKYFDKNGVIASNGVPDKKSVESFLCHKFFNKKPPKSLDRNSFINFYEELLSNNFSAPNTMATLAQFTIDSIVISFNYLPKKTKNILITGGGYKNKYLMECLKKRLDIKFLNENETTIQFDYVESELIAFLSARSLYNLPFTFPKTTGTSKALSGGKLYTFL